MFTVDGCPFSSFHSCRKPQEEPKNEGEPGPERDCLVSERTMQIRGRGQRGDLSHGKTNDKGSKYLHGSPSWKYLNSMPEERLEGQIYRNPVWLIQF